eukprot:scaffold1658_cov393-Prasinococcus_capsulatus_cf.AAC.21
MFGQASAPWDDKDLEEEDVASRILDDIVGEALNEEQVGAHTLHEGGHQDHPRPALSCEPCRTSRP